MADEVRTDVGRGMGRHRVAGAGPSLSTAAILSFVLLYALTWKGLAGECKPDESDLNSAVNR